MKSKILLITILFSSLIIGMLACNSGDWAVKIDNDTISIDELNRSYYIFNKTNFQLRTNEEVDQLALNIDSLDPNDQRVPYLIKNNYVEHLIAQRLVYKKAMSDPSLDRKELNTIIEMATMQTVMAFYLSEKFKDKVTVTDAEVEAFYMENRDRLRRAPLSDDLVEQIKQRIILGKSEIASREYMRDIMGESRINKEGFKEYMQKLNKDRPEEAKPE